MRVAMLAAALALSGGMMLAGCMTMPGSQTSFSPRLSAPRLDVVDASDLSEAQRDMLGSRANLNIYRTLAHHVDSTLR